MTEFLLALSTFLLAHAVPPLPAVRGRLVALLGRPAYLTLYSALSLVLIAWLISAAGRAPRIALWHGEPWHGAIPLVMMPIALWLLIAGLAEPNPLSVSLRATDATAAPGPGGGRHPPSGSMGLPTLVSSAYTPDRSCRGPDSVRRDGSTVAVWHVRPRQEGAKQTW